MSAYIVDKNHILYLLAAAEAADLSWYHGELWIKLREMDKAERCEVGNMLWRENLRSVSHRYPNESSATLPGPRGGAYTIEPRDLGLHWMVFHSVQVLKACNCYAYQTCEHSQWEESEAHAFIEALKSAYIRNLAGYDAAEWGAPKPYGTVTKFAHA